MNRPGSPRNSWLLLPALVLVLATSIRAEEHPRAVPLYPARCQQPVLRVQPAPVQARLQARVHLRTATHLLVQVRPPRIEEGLRELSEGLASLARSWVAPGDREAEAYLARADQLVRAHSRHLQTSREEMLWMRCRAHLARIGRSLEPEEGETEASRQEAAPQRDEPRPGVAPSGWLTGP